MTTETIKAETSAVDVREQLSSHAREEIDELLTHFPAEQKK